MSLRVSILQIGKTKTDYLKEGEAEYQKRLSAFCKLEIKSLKEFKGKTPAEQIALEGAEILQNLPHNSYLIALDEHGESMNSKAFAKKLATLSTNGHSHLCFVIGGPYGLSPQFLSQAKLKLSCSEFTFTHEMVRLILLEQIYRAFTINTGKKYHY